MMTTDNRWLALAAQIEADVVDLERVVSRAELIFEKCIRTEDDAYLDSLALNLHSFYAGVEHVFEMIARTIDGSLPDNPPRDSHLLRQMSVEIPTVRPAVISRHSYECLEEYRSFRHVVRNVYTFNLRGARLTELAESARPCLTTLTHDLGQFIETIRQLAQNE